MQIMSISLQADICPILMDKLHDKLANAGILERLDGCLVTGLAHVR